MLQHSATATSLPERVVLLGARGFVGSAIRQRCEIRGLPVHAVAATDIDFTDRASAEALSALFRRGDAIVFVSALTPDRGKDIATLMKNLAMAEHVCAALAAASGLVHVTYISSDAVYEDAASLVDEDSCCNPVSFHGVMHSAREKMLTETLRVTKVPLAILRASLLYGAGDTHNGYGPNRFLRTAIKDGRITVFGGGEEKRDHVYIEDVAAVVELCVQHRSAGVLNVATGCSHAFADVAESIIRQLGGEIAIEHLPRSGAIAHRHFDPSATYRSFPGFEYVALDEGLAAMIQRSR